jgi:membrane protein DedA with SNARE-associated domain
VIAGASLVADLVWYGIGRWASAHVLRLLNRFSRHAAERVKAAERQVLAHRFGFMLCCRFLPEVNPLVAAVAGAAHVAPGRYILFATISAVAWGGTWSGAGYALCQVSIAVAPASAVVAALMLPTGVIAAAGFGLKPWRPARSLARAH